MIRIAMPRSDRSVLSDWWWTVDRGLLVGIIGLILYGIVLVAAAGTPVALRVGLSENHFIIRHAIMLVPAIIAMFTMSLLSPRWIWRICSLGLIGGLLLMMIIPFVGSEIKGAQRWLHIGSLSLQPSEFVKPFFAVVAAWLMWQQKERPNFHGNLFAGAFYGLALLLLLIQPDLGMSVVLSFMFASQIFLAGFPFRYLFLMLVVGIVGMFGAYYGFDHVQSRIDRFLNPEAGSTYQIDKSLAAFQNGGFAGKGAGQGEVKMHLPDAHADFIFAVAGEELGFLLTLPLLGLFIFIILRVLNHLMTSDNFFAVLACGGLIAMFGLQTVVHMGSSMHLLPTKGMTLPFVSYGGTSVVAMGFSFGVILALTRRQGRFTIVRGLSRAKGQTARDTGTREPDIPSV